MNTFPLETPFTPTQLITHALHTCSTDRFPHKINHHNIPKNLLSGDHHPRQPAAAAAAPNELVRFTDLSSTSETTSLFLTRAQKQKQTHQQQRRKKIPHLLVEGWIRTERLIWGAARFWHYKLVYIAFPKGEGNPIFLFMEVDFLTDQWAQQHLKH